MENVDIEHADKFFQRNANVNKLCLQEAIEPTSLKLAFHSLSAETYQTFLWQSLLKMS